MRFVLLVFALSVAGCSSGNDLNEDNIVQAIEASGLDPSCVTTRLPASRLNQNFSSFDGPNTYQHSGASVDRRWRSLIDSGVAESAGSFRITQFTRIKSEFAPYFELDGRSLRVCLRDIKVTSVDNFTIPGDGADQQSTVDYSWVVNRETQPLPIIIAFPDLPTSGQATTVIELSNNGWKVRERVAAF